MLDNVLRLFNLQTNFDLDIMQPDQTLCEITAHVLLRLKPVLAAVQPDLVLVQGDTTSALAGSLAAFYARLPVAHIEAGLRTNHKWNPFGEETNRRLTTQIADLHFAPTPQARDHLLREAVDPSRIWVTGNTVVDALFQVLEQQKSKQVHDRLLHRFAACGVQLDDGRRRILVTSHRRESFGKPFERICQALQRIALRFPQIELVYPVHLNPNVREPARRLLPGLANLRLIEPVDYEEFIFLMNRSDLILTDSGGVQEEAPSLGKPVLVMRETTERPEGVEAGAVRLVGTAPEEIVSQAGQLLTDEKAYARMSSATNPYGDGQASERILQVIREHFGKEMRAPGKQESIRVA